LYPEVESRGNNLTSREIAPARESGEEGVTIFNHSTTLEVEAIMYTTDEDKYSEDETASDDV
jgi:hypothetical protein